MQIYSQSVEKTIDGKTYVIERNKYISNKANQIVELIKKENYNCPTRERIKELSSIEDIFRSILPQKKIDYFIKDKVPFGLIFYSDPLGNVLEVSFIIEDGLNTLNLKEIAGLEDALKKYRVELINTCPGVKYYRFLKVVRLWKQ